MVHDQARTNILLFGEDQLACKLVSYLLSEEGFNVFTANNPQAALAVLSRRDISLVIFDVVTPQATSVSLSSDIKKRQSDVPIMFLLSNGNSAAESLLASQCIDDYVSKPYSYTELVARVRAVLRRFSREALPDRVVMKVAGLELDVSSLTAALPSGKKVYLSPTEMKVLRCLMAKPGKIVSREQLTETVWGPGCGEDSYIRVCISRVRRKLGTHRGAEYIEAVRGAGYRLNVKDA